MVFVLSRNVCCRTTSRTALSSSFQASHVKCFVPWSPLLLCAEMCGGICCDECLGSVLTRSVLMDFSTPPAITSSFHKRRERQSFCCSIGLPPEKFSALECESGWSPIRPIVYSATLRYFSCASLVQISYIYLLNPSSELMHGMYMWV